MQSDEKKTAPEAEASVARPRRGTLTLAGAHGGASPPPSALPAHLANNVRHSRAPSIANVSVLDTLFFEDVTTGARSEPAESPLMSPGTASSTADSEQRQWPTDEGREGGGEAETATPLDPRLALEVNFSILRSCQIHGTRTKLIE